MVDTTPRAQEVFDKTGKWPSELAMGTDRDPDNVAPLVVYLASDAAAKVNGQVFHARGYRYTILSQPRAESAITGDARWEPEDVAAVFDKTLGAQLVPPPGVAFGTALDERPAEEWTPLGPGQRVWRNR